MAWDDYDFDKDRNRRRPRHWDRGHRYGWAGSGRAADRERARKYRGEGDDLDDIYEQDYYGYRGEFESGYRPDFEAERYRYGGGRGAAPGHPAWHRQGPYVGHGPQGYQRANERIVEDVNDRLTWHGLVDASKIQVSADKGEVTLEGTVESRRAKRMAEDTAESVSGVQDVHNRLRIERG